MSQLSMHTQLQLRAFDTDVLVRDFPPNPGCKGDDQERILPSELG